WLRGLRLARAGGDPRSNAAAAAEELGGSAAGRACPPNGDQGVDLAPQSPIVNADRSCYKVPSLPQARNPARRLSRRHSQVAKATVCKTVIPGSNPGAASTFSPCCRFSRARRCRPSANRGCRFSLLFWPSSLAALARGGVIPGAVFLREARFARRGCRLARKSTRL